jgi:3-hydroxyacyl-[acyl-carrier-protein] dehydratase
MARVSCRRKRYASLRRGIYALPPDFETLTRAMGNTTILHVPAHHPAFDGHFPGAPLLPGVVLLDEMLQAMRAGSGWTIATAKFLHPVRPGETLTLEHGPPLANGAVRFTIRSAGQPVASGTLIPRPTADESERHGHQAG